MISLFDYFCALIKKTLSCKMKSIAKILFALMLVSGILLLLDLENREKVHREELRIAVFKMIARPMLEDAERGIIEA